MSEKENKPCCCAGGTARLAAMQAQDNNQAHAPGGVARQNSGHAKSADEPGTEPQGPAKRPDARAWNAKYCGAVFALALLWWLACSRVAAVSHWLVFELLAFAPGSGPGAALEFFIYDTVKILLLLAALIYVIAWLRASLNVERVRSFLAGKGRGLGYFLGALFGSVTPFCSCSSIPLFLGFIMARIPIGVTMAFLITSPLINEVAVVLLWGLLGWKFTVIYVLTGLVAGMLGGLVMDALKAERWLQPFVRDAVGKSPAQADARPLSGAQGMGGLEDWRGAGQIKAGAAATNGGQGGGCCCQSGLQGGQAFGLDRQRAGRPDPFAAQGEMNAGQDAPGNTARPGGNRLSIRQRHIFAAAESAMIFKRVWKWVILGVGLGAALHGFVPDNWFASNLGSGQWWTVPVAVLAAIPLYSNVTGIIPVMESLLVKGLPIGTTMAFCMSAVAASLPEVMMLRQIMTLKLQAAFIAYLWLVFTLAGWLFNILGPWIL